MRPEDPNDVRAALQSLARDMERHHEAPPGLEGRLLAEYRTRRRRLAWRNRLIFGAIAASVLMLAVYGAMWLRRPVEPPQTLAITMPPQPARQATARAAAVSVTPRPAPRIRRPRRIEQPRRAEVVTGFIPFAGGDLHEPLSRGRVVRVKLPRPALRAFGLPMNEDRALQAITADVLVGEDGLARAIRFVQ